MPAKQFQRARLCLTDWRGKVNRYSVSKCGLNSVFAISYRFSNVVQSQQWRERTYCTSTNGLVTPAGAEPKTNRSCVRVPPAFGYATNLH